MNFRAFEIVPWPRGRQAFFGGNAIMKYPMEHPKPLFGTTATSWRGTAWLWRLSCVASVLIVVGSSCTCRNADRPPGTAAATKAEVRAKRAGDREQVDSSEAERSGSAGATGDKPVAHDHRECIRKAAAKFRRRIRKYARTTGKTSDPNTMVLMSAIEVNDRESLARLIADGADLVPKSDQQVSPLDWAMAVQNDWAFARLLKASPESATRGTLPTIVIAAKYDAELLRTILHSGVDPDVEVAYRGDKIRPIFAAIDTGNVESVRVLLEAKVDLSVRDRYGRTPLLAAASFKNYELAYILLEAGADPHDEYDVNRIMRNGIRMTRGPDGKMVRVHYPVEMRSFLEIVAEDRSAHPGYGKIREFSLRSSGSVSVTRKRSRDLFRLTPLAFHAAIDVEQWPKSYAKVVDLLREQKADIEE